MQYKGSFDEKLRKNKTVVFVDWVGTAQYIV